MSKHRTMTRAVERLQRLGYEDNIIIKDGQLVDSNTKRTYDLDKMSIDKIFRFDGETDPADESILYGITCGDHKGIFIESFGAYSCEDCEAIQERFLKEIKHYNDQDLWT